MTRYMMTDYSRDNRDQNQTDITLPDGTIIEIDPVDMFTNMLENCSTVESFKLSAFLETMETFLDESAPGTGRYCANRWMRIGS